MSVAVAVLAGASVAGLVAAMWRARREWRRGDELSPSTGALISGLWLLLAALAGVALVERRWPVEVAPAPAIAVGVALIVAGGALAVPGLMPFASVRQLYGVDRGGLITDGVYRFSRNPQYAGIGLALLGAGAAGRSGLALVVAAAYWAGVRAWLVVEEAHLRRSFGAEYVAYQRRTPRFFGRPRSDPV